VGLHERVRSTEHARVLEGGAEHLAETEFPDFDADADADADAE
jgi:hypothetical protein